MDSSANKLIEYNTPEKKGVVGLIGTNESGKTTLNAIIGNHTEKEIEAVRLQTMAAIEFVERFC